MHAPFTLLTHWGSRFPGVPALDVASPRGPPPCLDTTHPFPSLCSAPLRSPQLKHRLHCSPYEIRLSSPSKAFHCFSHTRSSILHIFYSIYIVFFLSSASFKNVLPGGGFSAHLIYYITEQEITLFHFLEIDNQI